MSSQKSLHSALQHKLKAPKKEYIVKLCNQAVLYKDLSITSYPEAVVADVSATLSITKGEAKQTISALSDILKKAIFTHASDPDKVKSTFPADLHTSLQDLLVLIVEKNFPEWKTQIIADNTSLPKLLGVRCEVEDATLTESVDTLQTSPTSCVLHLKIEDANVLGNEKQIAVKLTSEKLNAMLDGLGKIKDQLSSVTNR